MKYVLAIALAGIVSFSQAQTHSLTKLWETGPVFAIPESVFADVQQNTLYVSLIDGAPSAADGKGGIAKLSMDGKVADTTWVTGLNAPKGMGKYGNKLYVADLADVVVIDIATKKIERRITVQDAKILNDLSIDSKGIIYVSDSGAGKIHRIENGKAEVFLDTAPGINGLKSIGSDLYTLMGPGVQKIGADRKPVPVAEGLARGLDGIEPIGNGDFLVSCWNGILYYVFADGKFETLLDTRAERTNTADIGYDPAKKILYVPTFSKRTVVAFQLK